MKLEGEFKTSSREDIIKNYENLMKSVQNFVPNSKSQTEDVQKCIDYLSNYKMILAKAIN